MSTLSNKLIVAISSRALFDLTESNQVFEQDGIDAYAQYQIARENEPLIPGTAFPFVKKLLDISKKEKFVEVILLSRNSTDTGLRIFNSIQHYELDVSRAAFTNGNAPYPYVEAFGAHLFLSVHPEDVKAALSAGIAAARLMPGVAEHTPHDALHIAFDGDAVLFSDESEAIYQAKGLKAFTENERQAKDVPLPGGPFKGFLAALHDIQNKFTPEECPIRTGLVTARSAPSHERVIRTLRAWNIRIDEALFLGGLNKAEFLKAFKADIFFDDQHKHCDETKSHVTTGHVLHGIMNQE